MTALALFASTFCTVFALGFQSLNVNRGHYLAAALTSLFIGGGQLVLLKVAPGTDLTGIELLAYFSGGPLAIVASMWIHRRVMRPKGSGKVRRPRPWPAPPCTDSDLVHREPRANINCGADRP